MAHFIGCCCPRCGPSRRGCNEARTGVSGGICDSSNAMFGLWELEIEGVTVNENYCAASAEYSVCYKPYGSGADPGPETRMTANNNSRNRCYQQPLEDINGTYLVGLGGGCNSENLLPFAEPFYVCPSCGGNNSCSGASGWPVPPSVRWDLRYMLDLEDHSASVDFPGPVGAKMCLFEADHYSDGCSSPQNHEDSIYLANCIFRGVNPTLNCTTRNVWHNEITSGDGYYLTAGTYTGYYVAPFYYGGTITAHPVCP